MRCNYFTDEQGAEFSGFKREADEGSQTTDRIQTATHALLQHR